MKQVVRFLTSRFFVTIVLVLLEVLWLFILLNYLIEYYSLIETILRVVSVVIALLIVNYSQHLSSDLMWVILVLVFPAAGSLIYLFMEILDRYSNRVNVTLRAQGTRAEQYYHQDEAVLAKAKQAYGKLRGQFDYLSASAGFPLYRNQGCVYYPSGEEAWPAMLEAMEQAEDYIFLEYFIIKKGKVWDSVLEILRRKVKEGVDVRVLYDDFGSIGTLPSDYARQLTAEGVAAHAFNRINPLLNGIMNHRDHRKILVVDGRVGFTGGINLADEYMNLEKRFGYWKDNAIRIAGPAVWSMTVQFLANWNAVQPTDVTFDAFRVPDTMLEGAADGYVSPYAETPLDDRLVGQDIYLNLLNQAEDYVYIITPYLIIDEDMSNALILAAHRGVDVRILTPGIPDKKMVWRITRSYYPRLLEAGVQIWEYTPGFVHGKVFVCDDCAATVGTLNLDYRSLYLHFENGLYLAGGSVIPAVKDDFLQAQAVSRRIDLKDLNMHPLRAFFYFLLRIFAPLM